MSVFAPARPLALVPRQPADEAAFEALIIEGFTNRHLSINHRRQTIREELSRIAAFRAFVGRPPWLWQPSDMSNYGAALRHVNAALTTMRNKQGSVRRFLDFATDPAYEYNDQCFALTGRYMRQICSRQNTVPHRHGLESSKRRNYTDDELWAFFETAREYILKARRKVDRLSRQMHYTLVLVILAFGERAYEMTMTDLEDLIPVSSPEIAAFSPYEGAHVRFGKSHDGGPPTQRTVPAIYLFRCAFEALEWYLRDVRPHIARTDSPPAIFLGSRGGRLRADTISSTFSLMRARAGLPKGLALHCMRHTFQTKLHESGLSISITHKLLGHASETTTQIYDHVSETFLKERVLEHNRWLAEMAEKWQRSNGVCAQ